MSISRKRTLAEMIKKYPLSIEAVIDTFYSTVSNQSWHSEDVIGMLSDCLGVSKQSDVIIKKYIDLEEKFSK